MAQIFASSARNKNYNGTHGNASRTDLSHTAAAAPIGTVVVLGQFSAGMSIDALRLVHSAMGVGVTIDVGLTYPTGDKADEPAKFGNFDVAAAGVKNWAAKPVRVEHDCYLVYTVKGAPASGTLDVLMDYRFLGNGHSV